MKQVRSTLAPGHIVIPVRDLRASVEFYGRIGLPAFEVLDSIALIELRGGAHILLTVPGSPDSEGMVASRYGQLPPETGETLDLMIEGHTKQDLEEYRNTLIDNGIRAGEINADPYFGHYLFPIDDPDGNTIFVYTSHEIGFFAADPAPAAK